MATPVAPAPAQSGSPPMFLWAPVPVAAPPNDPDRDTILNIYKAYLEDLGRIGSRHETTRAFYLSVISALFVFLGLAGTTGIFAGAQWQIQMVVGVIGFSISAAWGAHMHAFSTIFAAKRKVLVTLEDRLPVKPFGNEASALPAKRVRVTHVDMATAVICCLLFGTLMVIKFNLAPVAPAGT